MVIHRRVSSRRREDTRRATAALRHGWQHESCIVTVHLAYARPDFQCLLDGELFLPEVGLMIDRVVGKQDSGRVVYRPNPNRSGAVSQAVANGLSFHG